MEPRDSAQAGAEMPVGQISMQPAADPASATAPDTRAPFASIDGVTPATFHALPTPCYLLDEAQLQANSEILGALAERTGCRILLAQKAFSNYDLYPILAPHLAGTEASGLYEARLGAE